MAIPVLIDTDVGTDVDDAIALALAVASPEIDLRAVTVVSGDVVLRGRVAKKLLELAGRATVPVGAGIRQPVLRRRNFLWLGHEGQGIVAADDRLSLSPTHGVDLLIDTVLRERPHVVAIGPLSNLAVAIMKVPEVVEAIAHLTLMGGVFGSNPDPNLPPVEYNLTSDAEAATVVLNAGIPTTVVPLDVTWRTFFTKGDLDRLRAARSPLVHTVCDAMEIWWPVHRQFFAATRTYRADIVSFLHDPLALTAVFDRSYLQFERRRLRAALMDDQLRFVEDPDAPPLEIAVDVDAPRFVAFLTERLVGFADAAEPREGTTRR